MSGTNGRHRKAIVLGVAAIPFVLGALIGYQLAVARSEGPSGGYGAAFVGLGLAFLIGVMAVLVVVGLLVGGSARRASLGLLGTTGLVVAGGLVGFAVTSLVNPGQPSSEISVVNGTATVRLEDEAFGALDDGRVRCRSAGNDEAPYEVRVRGLGTLGHGSLRLVISLPRPGEMDAEVELSIPDTDPPVVWHGVGQVAETVEDGRSGRVELSALARIYDTAGPSTRQVERWPATLSGHVTWTCEPWAG